MKALQLDAGRREVKPASSSDREGMEAIGHLWVDEGAVNVGGGSLGNHRITGMCWSDSTSYGSIRTEDVFTEECMFQ